MNYIEENRYPFPFDKIVERRLRSLDWFRIDVQFEQSAQADIMRSGTNRNEAEIHISRAFFSVQTRREERSRKQKCMLAVSYCSGHFRLHDFFRGVIWQFEIVHTSHDTWQGQI